MFSVFCTLCIKSKNSDFFIKSVHYIEFDDFDDSVESALMGSTSYSGIPTAQQYLAHAICKFTPVPR